MLPRTIAIVTALILSGAPAVAIACTALCPSFMTMTSESTPAAKAPVDPHAAHHDRHVAHAEHDSVDAVSDSAHAHHGHGAGAGSRMSGQASANGPSIIDTASIDCCPNTERTVVIAAITQVRPDVIGTATVIPAVIFAPAARQHRLPRAMSPPRALPSRATPLVLRV